MSESTTSARENEPGPASLIRIAVSLGLLAGLAEVIILAVKRAISPQVVFQTEDIIWMAPVADAMFLLALALVLVGLRQVLRGIRASFIVFLLAGLSAFIVIVSLGPLHLAAQVLIAAGVGVQLARLARRNGSGLSRFGRRALPLLAGVVLVLGVGLHLRRVWLERSGVKELAAAESGAPNVILLVLDTVRWFNLSSYGYPRATTPEIERWSHQAVRFDQALSTAPWTLPAHASLFTGKLPHQTSATWLVPLDDAVPTLAEVLRNHGYATAGFVANLNYTSRESGLARGFVHYDDYRIRPAEILLSSALGRLIVSTRTTQWRILRKNAELVNEEFLGWLDERPEGRPFFAFLNYFDAHDPYEPPAPFDARFGAAGGGDVDDLENREGQRGRSARLQAAMKAYDGAIAYMDHQIGALLAALEQRRLRENTILIITSDHGEQFGEKGLIRHGNSLYRALVQVPLFISVPGVTTARRDVPSAVSLRDIPATILELTGVEQHPLPGHSLVPLLRDTAGGFQPQPIVMELEYSDRLPKRGPIRFGSMKAVMDSGFRMIRLGNGKKELYGWGDSFDSLDLAPLPESAARLARLDSVLTSLVTPP